jgi:microcystin-dependent protein
MSKTTRNRKGSFSKTPTQSGNKFRIPNNSIGFTELQQAVINALNPIGTPVPTFSNQASPGHIMLDGLTIGKSGSGATVSGGGRAELKDIFVHFWTNLANGQAAVSGGRGASAIADWNAGKTLTLPDGRGRLLHGRDPTSLRVTGATTIGATGGNESVSSSTAQTAISIAQMPVHNHTFTSSSRAFQTNDAGAIDNIQPTGLPTGRQTAQSGSGQGHSHTYTTNVMQPYLLVNWQVRI